MAPGSNQPWEDLSKTGLGRRDFLQRGFAAAGLVTAGGLFAACGGDSKKATGAGAGTATAAGGGGKELKAAFAYNSPATDGGWSQQMDIARKELETAVPGVKTSFVESVPFSEEASQTFERLVADGNKWIFVGTAYGDFLAKVAAAHPDVMFTEVGGTTFTKNQWGVYPDQWHPSYLIGVAAGLLTKTNKLGYIASFPVPSVKSTSSALLLGARSVNPQAVVQAVAINSWFDPQAARQAASALIDGGADFTIGIMDEPAYLQVSEKRNVWTAGWNSDMSKFAPEKYVASIIFNWAPFFTETAKALLDGTFKVPTSIIIPAMPDSVSTGPWGKNVPEDVVSRAKEIQDKILNDGLNPFTGPLKDVGGKTRLNAGEQLTQEQVYGLSWVVEGVKGLK